MRRRLAAPQLLLALAVAGAALAPRGADARADALNIFEQLEGLDLTGVASVNTRRLLQLTPPAQVKYAPCFAAKEHTCSGGPQSTSGKQICCNKTNFACGVRSDNGEARCATW